MTIAETKEMIADAEAKLIKYKAMSAKAADELFIARQNAQDLDDHINRLVIWREELVEKLEKMKTEAV